ncbi:MAG: DNA mismatch repair protein MutS, partial [Candidatus Latescibacterota bacterium]|nr:DNA mismatch repair protein MutS [Candidatus Latescibacterota bacterium]
GLSLAWAIAESLASTPDDLPGPRTLFATHYHELTQLEEQRPGKVSNLHVTVREWGDDIVFLHRIAPGRTDRSYGIHVAKLAGLPKPTIARANQLLENLSVSHAVEAGAPARERITEAANRPTPNAQLPIFTEYLPHHVVNELRELKLESLSPLEAFDHLRKLQTSAQSDSKRD